MNLGHNQVQKKFRNLVTYDRIESVTIFKTSKIFKKKLSILLIINSIFPFMDFDDSNTLKTNIRKF